MTGKNKNNRYDHKVIFEMNKQGKTAQEIGDAVGAPAWYIRQILVKSGQVEPHKRIDKGKILALHNAGWTVGEICADTWLKPEIVEGVLNEQM